MSTTSEHALKRSDISALWFFIAAGVGFAAVIAFFVALRGTIFSIRERMQRDTEGLFS